jgi:hypothetical protein
MTVGVERPPEVVRGYAVRLTDVLLSAGNGEVCAAYVHGSAVLGGWKAAVSDVDVLVIVRRRLSRDLATALSAAALSTLSACPGTGLELSVVAWADAAAARPPWRFVAHVAGGFEGEPQVILGEDHPGDRTCCCTTPCAGRPAGQRTGRRRAR